MASVSVLKVNVTKTNNAILEDAEQNTQVPEIYIYRALYNSHYVLFAHIVFFSLVYPRLTFIILILINHYLQVIVGKKFFIQILYLVMRNYNIYSHKWKLCVWISRM